MPKKNPSAVSLGRLGGKARAARMTDKQRATSAAHAASARWAAMTPEQRSAEMKRRAKKRESSS